jgi:hypothetical protein
MAPKSAKEAKLPAESATTATATAATAAIAATPSAAPDASDTAVMEEDHAFKIGAVENDVKSLRVVFDGTQRLRCVNSQNSRSALVLAVTHKDIACTEAGYSDAWSVTPMTIVRIEDAGFGRAPFARGMSKQKMNDAKPLGVMDGNDLRMYSFKKAPMAKGAPASLPPPPCALPVLLSACALPVLLSACALPVLLSACALPVLLSACALCSVRCSPPDRSARSS